MIDKPEYPSVEEIASDYDADLILYSGAIDSVGLGKLIEAIMEFKRRPNVILILRTNGGSANAAYQIARFLQQTYKRFMLFAPSACYSAGTIVALGAHELLVTPFTELGPLDVQLLKLNEIGARKSGLLTRSAFEGLSEAAFEIFEDFLLKIMNKSGGLVSFRVAADVSASLVTGLMSPVFAKIDPDTVGGDRRDLEVALHYGMRLIAESGNADLSTLFHLVNHYPAHDCIIDDLEARDLFNDVSYPSSSLMLLSAVFGSTTYGDGGETEVRFLSNATASSQDSDHEDDVETVSGDKLDTGTDAGLGASGDANRTSDPESRKET